MYLFLPIIVAFEIVLTLFTSTTKLPSNQMKNNKVLGSEIAQITDITPGPFPTDTETPTPVPEITPDVTPISPETPIPATAEPTPSLAATSLEVVNPADTVAIVNFDGTFNSTENVNQQTIDEIQKEENTVNNIADPVAQTQVLVNLEDKKTQSIDKSIQQNDWSSVNLTTERFNDALDRIAENIGKVTNAQSLVLKQQISSLCTNSDPVLRTSGLAVPEGIEQEIEIGRGKCLAAQQ